MVIRTDKFKEVANTILLAASASDDSINLELNAKGNYLYLNVTNKEYYVSVKFELEQEETFRTVVKAPLLLNLVSGFTTETFELELVDKVLVVKSGKSSYKLAAVYENDALMNLPVIRIDNVTVDMGISNDILNSILTVNSKEISKLKNNVDVNELQRLYYIDETGCFTFTTGATVNAFTLEKPIKLLLNERVVKLFKLFKEDVAFAYGYDPLPNGTVQTKVSFSTSDIYVAAVINSDDILLSSIQKPCNAAKNYIKYPYEYKLVVSTNSLAASLSRLMTFTKNADKTTSTRQIPAKVNITVDELTITDSLGNAEVVAIENDSQVAGTYDMVVNLADLKLAVDSYKNDHVTINCGNHQSIVINCGAVSNLIPEGRRA